MIKNLTLRKITYFFFVLFLFVFCAVNTVVMSGAKAETSESGISMETSNVIDDLKSSTIDGEPFSLDRYKFDESGDMQVLSFVEYCYPSTLTKREHFGLYVYVYNPRALTFLLPSELNKIQFSYGDETHYTKYPLKYVNSSTGTYDGLFYKFRVDLTWEQRETLLTRINKEKRVYRVSGIELVTYGNYNATEYTVATTYTYSGYAKGYGSDSESTLTVKSKRDDTVLSLDVTPTFYRPAGTNGKNAYTQDSLHSVYFAVPNKIIERYGAMSAVHATWLNAKLLPMLVTGNAEAYKAISAYLGAYMGDEVVDGDGFGGGGFGARGEDLDYAYLGACSAAGGAIAGNIVWNYGYGYNAPSSSYYIQNGYGEDLDYLYFMFNAGSEENSADNYTVSTDELLTALQSSGNFGGELINDKYSERVFDLVDSEFTEVNIEAKENFSLTSELVSDSWWERLWGIGSTSKTFNGINAIYAVTDKDLTGTAEEIGARLYVDVGDVAQLKKDFAAAKNAGKTLYLFRYQVSDYVSQEATLFHKVSILGIETWEKKDSNAYFFQQTVNLDFDVIDVTFSNGITETVIPVVSSPTDVIHDVTPPVDTQPDDSFDISDIIPNLPTIETPSCTGVEWDKIPLWVWIVAGLIALFIIGKFFPAIMEGVKIVFLVVTAPIWFPVWLLYKFISWIIGKRDE